MGFIQLKTHLYDIVIHYLSLKSRFAYPDKIFDGY
jgi:hypothetical protein